MPRMTMKTRVTRPQAALVRYEVRFVNGQWTVFDRLNFNHGPGIGTKKQADRILADLTTGDLRWAA
jgi:hypothetical protein